MRSHRPVIAAIDPYRPDRAPAALGLLLAKLTREPLVLAAAYDSDPLYQESDEAARVAAERALVPAVTWAVGHAGGKIDVSSAFLPAEGPPARAIHELARRADASAIVVGSSARGRLGRLLPGAITDRILQGAPCPVAIAPTGFAADCLRRIGVAFVERPDGWAALSRASALAGVAGAAVRVLTVRDPMDWRFTSPLSPAQLAAMDRAYADAAERTLSRGLNAVPPAYRAGSEMLGGRPSAALASASQGLDLLVCGSRGRGPVRTLVLGSVAHALAREAACPLLIVPPGAPARAASDERVAA